MTPEKTKPFPWRCPACAKKAVQPATVQYAAQVKHDGRLYDVELAALRAAKCDACGEVVLDATSDEQITRALRNKLGLLQPDQIRAQRESFGLTQRELAERIGVAAESISRWESGLLVHSRSMDNLLRLFFAFGNVRDALCGARQSALLGLPDNESSESGGSEGAVLGRKVAAGVVELLQRRFASGDPTLRQSLIQHRGDLQEFFTSATELYAASPAAIRAFNESLASVACRIGARGRSGRGWVVVNVCRPEPRTNRLAVQLREVAEEVEQAPEDKTERFFELMRQHARLIVEK